MTLYTITAIVLTLAVTISYLNQRFIKMQPTIASTIGALLISLTLIILGKFGFISLQQEAATMLQQIPFHNLLINGMLSFLLFAGAMRINISDLFTHKWEIIVLAVGGVIASTFLIGIAMYYVLALLGIHIDFIYCLLFGALISPTDPIAVLATFKALGAPRKLVTIIEGESLFNDGVGIVMFITIYQLASFEHNISFVTTALLFLQQAIGGILYGCIIGYLASYLMRSVNDHKLEILITLLIVTSGYILAQALNISGPLAMVIAGIFVGNRSHRFPLVTKSTEYLDNFWELVEEILNAILFLLIGLELLIIHIGRDQMITALFAILLVLLARFITVFVPMSVFKIWRRYPRGTIRILIWGGLRGGLALALALSLSDLPYHEFIIGMTYAVVAFSVVIQGITTKSMLKLLR